jgi:UDP-glucose 4-epimerase
MSTTSFVTGAAGFIGSHLVDGLLARGHRVIGADNLVLGRRENLKAALKNPRFIFRELDVNDADATIAFLREQGTVDEVWHMAANSDIPAGVNDPDVDLRLTFLTTFNTLKAMHALGIPRIAFASSSAIYGAHDGDLREDTGPLFPISNYGAMKLASEGSITAALEQFLKRVWIFRFPNVVGGRATHGVIYDLLKKLRANPEELEVLGDGTQEKPCLHVTELVEAMLHIRDHGGERLNCFNIAPVKSAATVRFIAEAVVRAASPGARIRYTGGSCGWVGDVPKFSYSTEKLQALGWSPKLTSNAAIERAIPENLHLAK